MEPMPTAVVERLLSLSKIEVTESGCWISLYSTGSHGYAQIGWNCREPEACGVNTHMMLGHRLSWEHHNGPIPAGMTIDHICKIRRCINPDHLRVMSNLDNARDNGGVRTEPVPVGKKCGKGLHELLRYPSGAIACRECAHERHKRKDVRNVDCTICGKTLASSRGRRRHESTQH